MSFSKTSNAQSSLEINTHTIEKIIKTIDSKKDIKRVKHTFTKKMDSKVPLMNKNIDVYYDVYYKDSLILLFKEEYWESKKEYEIFSFYYQDNQLIKYTKQTANKEGIEILQVYFNNGKVLGSIPDNLSIGENDELEISEWSKENVMYFIKEIME